MPDLTLLIVDSISSSQAHIGNIAIVITKVKNFIKYYLHACDHIFMALSLSVITRFLDDTLLFIEKIQSLINCHYIYSNFAEVLYKDLSQVYICDTVSLPKTVFGMQFLYPGVL